MQNPPAPPALRPVSAPSTTLRSMARALAHRPGRPGPDTTVPSHGIELDSWTASSGLLAEYREVVGSTATQPIGFPTVVATRLLRDLMGLGRIPVSGRGLVHVASHLWTSGRLPMDRPWQVRAWVDGTRHTRSGLELDVWAEAGARAGAPAGSERWTLRMVALARSREARGPQRSARPWVETAGPWDIEVPVVVPVDAGWSYARVSGDYNPIHLNLLTARPFGYPRPIAHGWWTFARTLAALGLDETPPEGERVLEVTYRAPVLMPSGPTAAARTDDGTTTVALLRDDGATHLGALLR